MDNFRYPTTEQGLQSLVTRPVDPNIKNWKDGGYIDGLKKDKKNISIIAGGKGKLDRPLTRADIDAPTPYNTYVIAGLPPGPICNPGE